MINKGYRFRIYPNKEQKEFFDLNFDASRFVYNWALGRKKEWYQIFGNYKTLDIQEELKYLKKSEKYGWIKQADAKSLIWALFDLNKAFKNFFERIKKGKKGKDTGFPKFKSKKDNINKYKTYQRCKIIKGKLDLPKVKGIKIIQHRVLEGIIKNVTITKTNIGEYYASIITEIDRELPEKKPIIKGTAIGIDMGIHDIMSLSNGEKIGNPRWYNKTERCISRENKSLSRKVKGSKNYEKQKVRLAKVHKKLFRQRSYNQHGSTRNIINKFDTVCLEDLNVSGMIKDRCLAKAISDVGMKEIRRQLEYKADWDGKNIVVIDRWFPSSKTCFVCGKINDGLTLSDRKWKCECGATYDRDVNAAQNILKEGLRIAL